MMISWFDTSEPTVWQNLQCSLFGRCPKTFYYLLSEFHTMCNIEDLNLGIVAAFGVFITLPVLMLFIWPYLKSVCNDRKTTDVSSENISTETINEDGYVASDETNVQPPGDSAHPIRYGVRVYPPEVYDLDHKGDGENKTVGLFDT